MNPLRDGLSDSSDPTTPLVPQLKHVHLVTDGCKAQFWGKTAFLWLQDIIHDLKSEGIMLQTITQFRLIAHHGKSDCDSAGNLEAGIRIKKAASSRDSCHSQLQNATVDGSSSHEVCMHGATAFAVPKSIQNGTHDILTQKWGGPSKIVRFNVPPQAIRANSKKAHKGFDGSSKSHCVASSGNGKLISRRDWCGCSACMASPIMMASGCLRQLDVGAMQTHIIKPATPAQLLAEVRELHPTTAHTWRDRVSKSVQH